MFLWKTQYDSANITARKDRNSFYEAIKAHNAVVTCSVFAPNPNRILDQISRNTAIAEEQEPPEEGAAAMAAPASPPTTSAATGITDTSSEPGRAASTASGGANRPSSDRGGTKSKQQMKTPSHHVRTCI